MTGSAILPSLVRAERAPTRHQTQNPGPGIMTPNPGFVLCPKCGRRSALEALVGLAVVKQVADAVHRVLEQGCGGEHDHPDLRIHKRDDVKSGNEPGNLADETEILECFHGDRVAVSTTGGRCG
jgi:hypothetical protein